MQEDDLEGAILALFDGEDEGGSDVDIDGSPHEGGGSRSRPARDERRKRTKSTSGNASAKKRRRTRTYEEEEDDGDDDNDNNDSDFGGRGVGGNENEDYESDGPVDEWDSDLMGDDEDRERLMAMPEFEREKILAERQEQRDTLLEQRELKRRLRRDSQLAKPHSMQEYRSLSSRQKSGKSKLSELRRRRENRENRWSRSGRGDYEHDYGDEGEYLSEDMGEYSEEKPEELATQQDLMSICLTRDQLVNWIYSPFFKSTVVGCFVRVNMGNRSPTAYQIAEIKAVVENTEPYCVNGVMTDKRLSLKHGKQTNDLVITIISNSPFTESEFEEFERTLKSERVKRPTLEHVQAKRKDLRTAATYVLTDAEITQMVQERKKFKQVPENLAMK
ncbi:RNA polymerase-associated protein rtf1, partial [Spiromyces aspiralis]